MAPKVLVEEEVLDYVAERPVVGDPLVEVEVRIDDLLDDLLDLVVEGQPDVLAGVHACRGIKCRVPVQLVHHLAEGDTVLGPEVEAEPFVQLGDDLREHLDLVWLRSVRALRACGVQHPRPPIERDPTAARLPNPVRLHVDVLLDLDRQLLPVGGQQPAQVTREDVELLQIGVGERQHLGEEGVEPHVVGELAAEALPLVLVKVLEPPDDGIEHRVEAILLDLGVEEDPGEAVHVGLRVHREPFEA